MKTLYKYNPFEKIVKRYNYEEHRKQIYDYNLKSGRYFLSKAEAKLDYKRHLTEADARLDKIEKELNELLQKNKAYLSYVMDGDTHGIYEDYLYISVELNGYTYIRELQN